MLRNIVINKKIVVNAFVWYDLRTDGLKENHVISFVVFFIFLFLFLIGILLLLTLHWQFTGTSMLVLKFMITFLFDYQL
jgi:hypothetical protein